MGKCHQRTLRRVSEVHRTGHLLQAAYRGGTGPVNLLAVSTGIKSEDEREWKARKHGGPKRRIWRKVDIGIV